MKNNLVSGVGFGIGALAIVLIGFAVVKPTVVVNAVNQTVGSASSPSVVDGIMDVNGFASYFKSASLNNASTTLCSFKSPAATSTLRFGSLSITTATTSATAFEIGRAFAPDATTTRLAYVALAASAKMTLTTFVASTTNSNGPLAQSHTADEQDLIFGPNTYFVAKWGGGTGGVSSSLKGACKAEFTIN